MSEEKFRYRVGRSKNELAVWNAINGIYIISTLVIILFPLGSVDMSYVKLFLFIEAMCIVFLLQLNEHIDVYKGKCIYKKLFSEKIYLIKEFGEPQIEMIAYFGGYFNKSESYVFYDEEGNVMFYLPVHFENSNKLFKEIKAHYKQVKRSVRGNK